MTRALTQEELDRANYFVLALEGNWEGAQTVAIAPFPHFEQALVHFAMMPRFEGETGTEYYRVIAERCSRVPDHIHQISAVVRIGEDGYPVLPENDDPLFLQ